MTFDATVTDTKDLVARSKHLRVEKLVKLQARPCGVCKKPIVYAVASSQSGKRLPFDIATLLNNSLKVVVGSDESLEVWPFRPTAHKCETRSNFHPSVRIDTDGEGRFLGVTYCLCDDGSPSWPGHSNDCPLGEAS